MFYTFRQQGGRYTQNKTDKKGRSNQKGQTRPIEEGTSIVEEGSDVERLELTITSKKATNCIYYLLSR